MKTDLVLLLVEVSLLFGCFITSVRTEVCRQEDCSNGGVKLWVSHKNYVNKFACQCTKLYSYGSCCEKTRCLFGEHVKHEVPCQCYDTHFYGQFCEKVRCENDGRYDTHNESSLPWCSCEQGFSGQFCEVAEAAEAVAIAQHERNRMIAIIIPLAVIIIVIYSLVCMFRHFKGTKLLPQSQENLEAPVTSTTTTTADIGNTHVFSLSAIGGTLPSLGGTALELTSISSTSQRPAEVAPPGYDEAMHCSTSQVSLPRIVRNATVLSLHSEVEADPTLRHFSDLYSDRPPPYFATELNTEDNV